MPAGELQVPFAELCRDHGIRLIANPPDVGLTNRGYLDIPDDTVEQRDAIERLRRIFNELGGDVDASASKRARALRPDFLLEETGHLVELDEVQHFTRRRLKSLAHYEGLYLPWAVEDYQALCRANLVEAEKAHRNKAAVDFPGEFGRQRQRAYLDAVRDIGAPVMSECPGVVRVAVPERRIELGLQRLQAQLEEIGG